MGDIGKPLFVEVFNLRPFVSAAELIITVDPSLQLDDSFVLGSTDSIPNSILASITPSDSAAFNWGWQHTDDRKSFRNRLWVAAVDIIPNVWLRWQNSGVSEVYTVRSVRRVRCRRLGVACWSGGLRGVCCAIIAVGAISGIGWLRWTLRGWLGDGRVGSVVGGDRFLSRRFCWNDSCPVSLQEPGFLILELSCEGAGLFFEDLLCRCESE